MRLIFLISILSFGPSAFAIACQLPPTLTGSDGKSHEVEDCDIASDIQGVTDNCHARVTVFLCKEKITGHVFRATMIADYLRTRHFPIYCLFISENSGFSSSTEDHRCSGAVKKALTAPALFSTKPRPVSEDAESDIQFRALSPGAAQPEG